MNNQGNSEEEERTSTRSKTRRKPNRNFPVAMTEKLKNREEKEAPSGVKSSFAEYCSYIEQKGNGFSKNYLLCACIFSWGPCAVRLKRGSRVRQGNKIFSIYLLHCVAPYYISHYTSILSLQTPPSYFFTIFF
jgi:hypothetical protein